MAKRKINHGKRITSKEPIPWTKVIPGMIVEFKYKAEEIYDKFYKCFVSQVFFY